MMKSLAYLLPDALIILFVFGCSPHKDGVDIQFKKNIIHPEFISEGVAVADVNKDGLMDILAGPYWFEAPDWNHHEIRSQVKFDYTKGWSDSFLNFAMDVNEDGWIDFISIDFPGTGAYWYENPKAVEQHWIQHTIDTNACNESPMMGDLDDDGRLDLVFGSAGQMVWFKAPKNGAVDWIRIPISAEKAAGTQRFSHGLGMGDMNKDGRNDILIKSGWWEAPDDFESVPWQFHAADLGQDCSQMYVMDLDKDGDEDVISASAHNYGVWWHEQRASDKSVPVFDGHVIDSSFSQSHGVALVDINGDGLPDIITGKRFYAHNGKDPGGNETPVIYWMELKRDGNNQPHWIPHLIDDNSGVGLQVVTQDMTGDGDLDIIISNKKGVFYFEQE